MSSGFDRLARPYRWMEYLSFGRALERCRFRFLPQLAGVRSALVLGDGDGRFAARLVRTAPQARICAVDASRAMLHALQTRCASEQVRTLHADLSQGLPGELYDSTFDLVSTHFFLDCLNATEVDALARDLAPRVQPDGCWIVSEFDVPHGALRLPASILIRLLYLCFRVMTGLRAQHLPEWRGALTRNGFQCVESAISLGGLLVSERWTPRP